jgi:hypothetical protein
VSKRPTATLKRGELRSDAIVFGKGETGRTEKQLLKLKDLASKLFCDVSNFEMDPHVTRQQEKRFTM